MGINKQMSAVSLQHKTLLTWCLLRWIRMMIGHSRHQWQLTSAVCFPCDKVLTHQLTNYEVTVIWTSGQSHLTLCHITGAHDWCSIILARLRQCAPPSNTFPWTHLSAHCKRHLDQFSCFCRVHNCDRPTDHATPSVTTGRIYVVLQCNLIIIITRDWRCFIKHKLHAGHQKGQKCRFLSLVTLTFDLDLQTRPGEGPNMSSVWIWHKSVQWFPRYFTHKKHTD